MIYIADMVAQKQRLTVQGSRWKRATPYQVHNIGRGWERRVRDILAYTKSSLGLHMQRNENIAITTILPPISYMYQDPFRCLRFGIDYRCWPNYIIKVLNSLFHR